MYSLLIETSTERGVIALFKADALLLAAELPFGYQNSKFLLPMLQKLFFDAELKPTDLRFIAAGIGPGSYTGMRVGAITAKAMAYALKIPVIGVCSLDGLTTTGSYAAVIDAKIGGVYLQKAGFGPDIYSLEQAKEFICDVDALVTPYAEALQRKLPHPKWVERYPDALAMMQHARSKFQAGDYAIDGHLDLLYLRRTQAEIEKG